MYQSYDVIGDVHGCAKTLEALLLKLGYHKVSGIYRHSQRKVVFLGDIIDRGPRIREALALIHGMVDKGFAHCLIGNHEYNAINLSRLMATDTSRQQNPGQISARLPQISATLEQFDDYPSDWKAYLHWLAQLPVFLDLGGFRAVHACWDPQLIEEFHASQSNALLPAEFIQASLKEGSFERHFIDRLTRGTSLMLPNGRRIVGRDGRSRRFFRTKFWVEQPKTYADVIFQPDPLPVDLRDRALTEAERTSLAYYGKHEKPLFVGHYWLRGDPAPIRPNIACLDYSAVTQGALAAYRFDGEKELCASKFVTVPVSADFDS